VSLDEERQHFLSTFFSQPQAPNILSQISRISPPPTTHRRSGGAAGVLAGAGVHRPLRARGSAELVRPRRVRGRGVSRMRSSTTAAGCRPPGCGGPSSAISPVREPKQGRPAAERAPSWASPPACSPVTATPDARSCRYSSN
jgi:hypothetical protein